MVVQLPITPTAPAPSPPSLLDQVLGLGMYILIAGIIIAIIYVVVRWLTTKKEHRGDIYTTNYKETLKTARMQKDPEYIQPMFAGMPMFLGSKGTPIWLNFPHLSDSKQYGTYSEMKEKLKTEAPSLEPKRFLTTNPGSSVKIGTYAGSAFTNDGCWTLLLKSQNLKVMGLFPQLIVLKLRMKSRQLIPNPEKNNEVIAIEIPPDSFRRSKQMISIDCMGIDKIGHFFYTVNMTDEGQIVDTKPYIYQDMISIAQGKQLLDIGRTVTQQVDEIVKWNPTVQGVRKTEGGLTQE